MLRVFFYGFLLILLNCKIHVNLPNRFIPMVIDFCNAVDTLMKTGCSGDIKKVAMILSEENLRSGVTSEILAKMATKVISFVPEYQPEKILFDIVGTGGDCGITFNVSTAAAFMLAAVFAGPTFVKHPFAVAKFGGSASGKNSGSVDVLNSLGVHLAHSFQEANLHIESLRLAFISSRTNPVFEKMRVVRHELRKEGFGFTIFNLLGPLVNPTNPQKRLIGVSDSRLMIPMTNALKTLGVEKALVVCGHCGEDEVSIMGPTEVMYLDEGKVSQFQIEPSEFDFEAGNGIDICGGSPDVSATIISNIFKYRRQGSTMDIVVLNAGCALFLTGLFPTIEAAVRHVKDIAMSNLPRALFLSACFGMD